MKAIIFSLWGDNIMYWNGAIKNIELASIFYPDWKLRFYIDESSNPELISKIVGDNVEVILMSIDRNYKFNNHDKRFDHSGIFWRFLALKDSDIDVLLFRDCDSRISKREVDAVNTWLSSDKDFHIMRDHPYHLVPILSGMWGCKNNILSNIDDLLNIWFNWPNKGIYQAEDQDFLGQIIYPIVKNNSLEHSEFGISYGNNILNFPTNRENYEFIGDVFDENDVRHPEYWKIIKNKNI